MAKPFVIGIDMGGTNTAFGIVDARGTVIASSSIKTGIYQRALRRTSPTDSSQRRRRENQWHWHWRS